MQETRVRALIQEDPTRCTTAKPDWACAPGPKEPQSWSAPAAITETHAPQRLCPQQGSHHTTAVEQPPLTPPEKSLQSNKDPAQPKINKQIKLYKAEGRGKIQHAADKKQQRWLY